MNPYTQKSGFINQVSSKHEEPEAPTSRKPTPGEALELGIKLPWAEKVQQVNRDLLTKELFISLEEYGLTRDEIRRLFISLSIGDFYKRIKAWDLPPAPPGGTRKAVRAGNMEKPVSAPQIPLGKPGQSRGQIAEITQKAEAEMDAELLEVEQKLAEIESPHQPTQDERNTFFDESAAAVKSGISGLAINQDHYNASGTIQPIEAMQANMTRERFIGFCQGNCIKYSCRAGRKDDEAKEVDKVIQYATWWRQALDGKTINPREA